MQIAPFATQVPRHSASACKATCARSANNCSITWRALCAGENVAIASIPSVEMAFFPAQMAANHLIYCQAKCVVIVAVISEGPRRRNAGDGELGILIWTGGVLRILTLDRPAKDYSRPDSLEVRTTFSTGHLNAMLEHMARSIRSALESHAPNSVPFAPMFLRSCVHIHRVHSRVRQLQCVAH